ncbi:MAG: gfo/Idh/MocA family oxidoreductase [Chitinivibrionales bacterium]|nr:gfo/Idh/MocA family oxidoreductase [Chitinivibrionales bacterium]
MPVWPDGNKLSGLERFEKRYRNNFHASATFPLVFQPFIYSSSIDPVFCLYYFTGMSSNVQWGIIATGDIAHTFASQFSRVPGATLLGVGSRSAQRAEEFARTYGIPRSYGSYRALVDDPAIDAVYIATPHNLHYENTLMALEAGKAVLCEKPFALNAVQAREMVNRAREKNLFCMEAMWARFNPAFEKALELLEEHALGTITDVHADFSIYIPYDPVRRWYNPELGGGSLLDVGVYPLWLSHRLLGMPKNIHSSMAFASNGVDEKDAIICEYAGGAGAVLTSGFRGVGDRTACITGTKASLIFHSCWHRATKLTLHPRNGKDQTFSFSPQSQGLHNETRHVTECLVGGKKESDAVSFASTIEIMEMMDSVRARHNLRYPGK